MSVQALPPQRRSTRFDFVRDLSASVQVEEEEQTYSATILNLSTNGASLVANAPIRRGDEIRLVVDSRIQSVQLTCLAKARWSRPEKGTSTAFGCEFSEAIHDDCFDRLSAAGYVNRRRDARVPTDLIADARSELNRDESVRVRIADYSLGGLRLYSSDPIELGQRVMMTMEENGATVVATPIWQCHVPTGYFFGCSFRNGKKNFVKLQAAEQAAGLSDTETAGIARRPISGWVWAGFLLALGAGVGYTFGWIPTAYQETVNQSIRSAEDAIRSLRP